MKISKETAIKIIKDKLKLSDDYPVIESTGVLFIDLIGLLVNTRVSDIVFYYIPYLKVDDFGYDLPVREVKPTSIEIVQNRISIKLGVYSIIDLYNACYIRVANHVYIIPNVVEVFKNED